MWNSGTGGTGWIQQASSLPNAIQDRYQADVIAFSPDVVIFSAGRNDYSSSTASVIGAAAGTVLAAVRAALPRALLVVTGPNGAQSPVDGTQDATWAPMQTAIFSAVAPYVDFTLDWANSAIFTGTGKAGTSGTGNGNNYIQSDNVHPTGSTGGGAAYLGERLAHKFQSALTFY